MTITKTAIQWTHLPGRDDGYSANPIRFRDRELLPSPLVEGFHLGVKIGTHRLNIGGDGASWAGATVARKCRDKSRMFIPDVHVGEHRLAKEFGPLPVEHDAVLRFPSLPYTSVIIELDVPGEEFCLKPLDHAEMGHRDCHDRVVREFLRPDMANGERALTIQDSGDIRALLSGQERNWVRQRKRLPARFGALVLSLSAIRFRRILFRGHMPIIQDGAE